MDCKHCGVILTEKNLTAFRWRRSQERSTVIRRRDFLVNSGLVSALATTGESQMQHQLAGLSLSPAAFTKYVDPLPVPEKARPLRKGHYRIVMREFQAKIHRAAHLVIARHPGVRQQRAVFVQHLQRELVAGARGKMVYATGDADEGIWSAGQVQGLIHDIPSCAELVSRIMRDAEAIIQGRFEGMMSGSRRQAAE